MKPLTGSAVVAASARAHAAITTPATRTSRPRIDHLYHGYTARMPATRIEIKTADGVAPAFEFGAPSSPKVLMLIDGLGMRPAMHEIAERIAAAGFRVLMPDLFYRMGAYTSPDPTKLFTDPEVRAAWWGK